MKKYLITLVAIGLASTSHSQAVRKYSNEFLNIGVGARGLAMSNAQVATTQDVYSNYYNPAGLIHIPNTFQVGIMHSEYFAGIAKYDFVSFAISTVQSTALAFLNSM